MTDFYFDVSILRDNTVNALCDNPEQLAYVLGEIANRLNPDDLADHRDNIERPVEVAAFYRSLADRLDPAGA